MDTEAITATPAVLRIGARVRGLSGSHAVTVKSVDRIADEVWEVITRDDEGRTDTHLVYRENLARLTLADSGSVFGFDADGRGFRLAAEARRMRLAHLFDPQQALGTSDVDPLPHQLKAVYQDMLPKLPLRYVLADDPGAGKTIMAGLLVKELLLRGDAASVLIVAPGSLVDQWQDELADKFGLDARTLTRDVIDADRNPFERGGLWLGRLDVLKSNSQGILDKACDIDWDLVVVDEAHKMSANVWAGEVRKSRRYELGERLGQHTRNLLLMTATPHSGKEEQFQLFMALLDSDRFERGAREGTRRVDVSDLMRRMVKEELLTFEGTRLFPERRSYTVKYDLTPAEADLYRDVTDYVRNEMNRADLVDGSRRRAVGFALTTLQRRLASSPTAIYNSLERRLNRLRTDLSETRLGHRTTSVDVPVVPPDEDPDNDSDDYTDDERQAIEDEAVASATAARTIGELEAEVAILEQLVQAALRVKSSPSYAKWDKLAEVLDSDDDVFRDESGQRRKLIIFTEHKDTLYDLTARLRDKIGRDEAVVTIHGGTRREDRKKAQETFKQDDACTFLVATDAAGEGVNLQNAHLLVNFDLPWNPNRIEQRFGRIHRIKQRNVCHMWSLLAADTREGDVFDRLLAKIEQQRLALGKDRVFDVLGTVFNGNRLRDLMIDAIKYGDDPKRQAELLEVVDAGVTDGIQELLDDHQLVPTGMDQTQVDAVRRDMERAEAARLQPHHVEAFFLDAFADLGGTERSREQGRHELRNVPARIRERDRVIGRGTPVVAQYHRITFDPKTKRVAGFDGDATLMHPGHPLMVALVSLTADDHGDKLRQGTILTDLSDVSVDPYLVCLLEHDMVDGRTGRDGQPIIVSRKVQFVRLDADGTMTPLPQTPIPNLDVLDQARLAQCEPVKRLPVFNAAGVETTFTRFAASTLARDHAATVEAATTARVEKTRRLVRERLTAAIGYWDRRAAELREQERTGKQVGPNVGEFQRRADNLTRRLQTRMDELDREAAVSGRAPRITGACLVIPQGWFDAQTDPDGAASHAKETERVERAAVDAVLAIERGLGHSPVEMPRNNPGYDIESDTPDGLDFIEVKGRIAGADDFVLTRQEAVTLLNKGHRAVLAIAEVDTGGNATVRYIRQPMDRVIDPRAKHVVYRWAEFWNDGQEMQP